MITNEQLAKIEEENKKYYASLPKFWHYDFKGNLLSKEQIKAKATKFKNRKKGKRNG